jgi:hypothetical protein
MTKALKELTVILLIGAGLLTLLWGLMHQIDTAIVPGQTRLVGKIVWSAVYSGAGLIVVGAALQVFLRPAK